MLVQQCRVRMILARAKLLAGCDDWACTNSVGAALRWSLYLCYSSSEQFCGFCQIRAIYLARKAGKLSLKQRRQKLGRFILGVRVVPSAAIVGSFLVAPNSIVNKSCVFPCGRLSTQRLLSYLITCLCTLVPTSWMEEHGSK